MSPSGLGTVTRVAGDGVPRSTLLTGCMVYLGCPYMVHGGAWWHHHAPCTRHRYIWWGNTDCSRHRACAHIRAHMLSFLSATAVACTATSRRLLNGAGLPGRPAPSTSTSLGVGAASCTDTALLPATGTDGSLNRTASLASGSVCRPANLGAVAGLLEARNLARRRLKLLQRVAATSRSSRATRKRCFL